MASSPAVAEDMWSSCQNEFSGLIRHTHTLQLAPVASLPFFDWPCCCGVVNTFGHEVVAKSSHG